MAKAKTLSQLKDLRAQLEIEVNEAQTELATREYSVDLENTQNINAVLKQIDKSYQWNIKNAAFLINLYDSISDQKRINANAEEKTSVVKLNNLQINTLYTVLTNITGTGIESARTFTRLLTNVGAQISDALKEMAVIYDLKINNEANALLKNAQSTWAANPNEQGGQDATAYIMQINPKANSYANAAQLLNTINTKLIADERERKRRQAEYEIDR